MKRRPASKAELLARMPRAFRPKLDASQRRDLGLCHIANLDSIARGEATLNAMSSAAMAYRAGLGREPQLAIHASREVAFA